MNDGVEMARLKQRLSQLGRPGPSGGTGSSKVEQLRGRLEAMERRLATSKPQHAAEAPPQRAGPRARVILDQVPGTREKTHQGEVQVARQLFGKGHCHGQQRINRANDAWPDTLASLALDPNLSATQMHRVVYLDTETTGLAGGAGTLPFLVGIGQPEGEGFRVSQYLLTSPAQERPLLEEVGRLISDASALVTYNGKSFDWPLLRTRFIMNRMAVPPVSRHLDLLHVARRILKGTLTSVRLVDVEREVLGFVREGDIDSAEIPETYWRFLRTGNGSLLVPILDHNVYDILALAAFLGRIAADWQQKQTRGSSAMALGYAQTALRDGDLTKAYDFVTAATRFGRRASWRAFFVLGKLELQRGNVGDAARVLLEGLDSRDCTPMGEAQLHLALAKVCEHRLRDFDRAAFHAGHTVRAEGVAASKHRLARLRRRRQRATAHKQGRN